MKVILLTSKKPTQVALAARRAKVCELSAIVLSENVPQRRSPDANRIRAYQVASRVVGRPFLQTWRDMMRHYEGRFPNLPETRQVRVRNVNDAATTALIDEIKPDLVLVSGTNLVAKRVIEKCQQYGPILNLHTGISPYVKGGPNCTNWCLATQQFHLIGNTIMWIDPGIDTGALVTTERTSLTGRESLLELHVAVMDHAHDLYARAVATVARGAKLPRVEQSSLGAGTTFFTRDWNPLAMVRAQLGFRKFNANSIDRARELAKGVTLVALPAEG